MRYVMRVMLSLWVVCFCSSIYAWNTFGHMVIASIAYQHLKPEIREKINQLITFFHQEYPEMNSFLEISYWPDALRAQKIATYVHWHYIDQAFSPDGTTVHPKIDTDNAVWAVNKIKPIVKNSHANQYERVRYLAFLTHIVSDLHQPLHTVTYVSAEHPQGDKGGNLYFVRINGQLINLHKLWDRGLGEFENPGKVEQVHARANEIMNRYPVNYFSNRVADLKEENWVNEGMMLAKQAIYVVPERQIIPIQYLENLKKISEQQAALAAYRLAGLLNQLLK